MSAALVYPYRYTHRTLALFMLGFGFSGVFGVYLATGNPKNRALDRILRLGHDEATLYYSAFGAIMLGFIPLFIYSAIITSSKKVEIALEPSGIRLPVGLARREAIISYVDIKSILHKKFLLAESVTITRRDGKRAAIVSFMLPKGAFANLRAELAVRTRLAQQL